VKRLLQTVAGRLIYETDLKAALTKNAAVVVTFHRIDDLSDSRGLTISVEMFERYCRFFKRHFRVSPLRTIADKLARGVPLRGELAITFDDGYRDNFENAARVLEKLSLPATFFVVSHWIGSQVVPWWDQEQGLRVPWMTWEQVRSLHQRGFDIGAHTRTHVDLGDVTGAAASAEIIGARREIEQQLGAAVDLFAYPYGGRAHLTEANRELVRSAGFRCCCSAFAGINDSGTDPFDVKRIPISPWYISPYQFGFDVARDVTALGHQRRRPSLVAHARRHDSVA
jgi:peptidoglycan/xylan/chitin deacetylase (PgdA/CDA1 family)